MPSLRITLRQSIPPVNVVRVHHCKRKSKQSMKLMCHCEQKAKQSGPICILPYLIRILPFFVFFLPNSDSLSKKHSFFIIETAFGRKKTKKGKIFKKNSSKIIKNSKNISAFGEVFIRKGKNERHF